MKKFAAVLFGVVSLGTSSYAQDLQMVRVTIPFSFKAGNVSMPPGQYTVEEANEAGLMRIAGWKESAMMITRPGVSTPADGQTSLAFEQTARGTVLKEIRLGGHPVSILPIAKGE